MVWYRFMYREIIQQTAGAGQITKYVAKSQILKKKKKQNFTSILTSLFSPLTFATLIIIYLNDYLKCLMYTLTIECTAVINW